jgi:hypothetical protein
MQSGFFRQLGSVTVKPFETLLELPEAAAMARTPSIEASVEALLTTKFPQHNNKPRLRRRVKIEANNKNVYYCDTWFTRYQTG